MTFVVSLLLGNAVGVVYALLRATQPAPPLVALVGLLGMLGSERNGLGPVEAHPAAVARGGDQPRVKNRQGRWCDHHGRPVVNLIDTGRLSAMRTGRQPRGAAA